MTAAIRIGDTDVAPGSSVTVQLPLAPRYSADDVHMAVRVAHGKKSGPCLFVTAAVHGDEINGVEIVRRLLRSPKLRGLRGTLLAVPIVNIYGFLQQIRYLPDRRDLNRCFPGSERGSLAGRLAHVLRTEVVEKANVGIDLHTGSLHRSNLPQIRGFLEDAETLRLGQAFGAPVMLDSPLREGSLRATCVELGVPLLVYEAGQALRFDELAIRAGVRGILAVMQELDMLPRATGRGRRKQTFVARGSQWVRAPHSGVLEDRAPLGMQVAKGDVLGVISDPLGDDPWEVPSPTDGIVVGSTQLPLVNEGDALYHIAYFRQPDEVSDKIDALVGELTDDDFLPDRDEEEVDQ